MDTSDPPPEVRVEVSVYRYFTQQMEASLSSDMGILIGGAMILMISVMGILFAYVRYRFMPVLFVGRPRDITWPDGPAGIQAEHGGDRALPGSHRAGD